MGYIKEDIFRMVEEDDVEFIRLQFTDIFGTLKNVAITSSQLRKAHDNNCMFEAASIDGLLANDEIELFLHPDLDTYEVFPWRPQNGKVARLICDLCNADGTPYMADSRYILKKVIKDAADMGYTFDVGPELEFFLFHTDDDGMPTTVSHDRAGYFDLGPLDLGENARRDIVLTLEDMNYEIESSHHEVSPAQHEVDFKYADALKTADNIVTFKLVVKSTVKRHGLFASFMPKPKDDCAGSGMHINMSLSKDGVNIFEDKNDENGLSTDAYYFMAGIMKHIKAITAISNPIVNSYKRLATVFETPVCIGWSTKNKSPLIRIPSSKGAGARIELRSPDPSCNPYLALALCLAAGLDGIKNKYEAPASMDSVDESEIKDTDRLPWNLQTAIEIFEKDEFVKSVLGEELVKRYVKIKKEEWKSYSECVSKWEIDEYLYRV